MKIEVDLNRMSQKGKDRLLELANIHECTPAEALIRLAEDRAQVTPVKIRRQKRDLAAAS